MSDAIGLNLNIFLRSLVTTVGVIFFMMKLSWRLTIVTFIGLPCIMVVSEIYGNYYKVSRRTNINVFLYNFSCVFECKLSSNVGM